MKISVLVQPETMMAPKPGLGHGRAGVAAEQRVRRTGRQAEEPRDQVPGDRADAGPTRMTAYVTTSRSTMPDPTVFATAVPKKNAAAKLKNAATATACTGESTRVETTVAMELAAS